MHPTYRSNFRKRGAEKRPGPSGSSSQPMNILLELMFKKRRKNELFTFKTLEPTSEDEKF